MNLQTFQHTAEAIKADAARPENKKRRRAMLLAAAKYLRLSKRNHHGESQ